MQTELKLLDYTKVRDRILWALRSQTIVYNYAAAIRTVLLRYEGKTVNVRLKSAVEEQCTLIENNDAGFVQMCAAVGFHNRYVHYKADETWTKQPIFNIEVNWRQKDPDYKGVGSSDDMCSASFRNMPRTLTLDAIQDAFRGYEHLHNDSDRLAALLAGDSLKPAIERYNAALSEFASASAFGAGIYPLSVFMPYYHTKLKL